MLGYWQTDLEFSGVQGDTNYEENVNNLVNYYPILIKLQSGYS